MASLSRRFTAKAEPGSESNFGVDYVIRYMVPKAEAHEAEAGFIQLIEALTNIGLTTEVRPDDESILIFVKMASSKLLQDQAYRSRLQDWLQGVRTGAPDKDLSQSFKEEPVTDAERLRLVYLLITRPKNEGGAGVAEKTGQWKYVDSVFPLHDHAFNRQWLSHWSTKYFLDENDLTEIRDKFGENVAFYFAFMQSYFKLLLFPAAFGFGAWMILGKFSWFYALVNCLWSVVFFEFWKKKEVDLAIQWGVRGVSSIQHPRPQFHFDHEAEDPVTGEVIKVFSPFKRLRIQLLQIPFAVACIFVLGATIVTGNSLEIFINEVYEGPFKQYLTFLPTILLVVLIPTFSSVLTKWAEALTDMENYETLDSHHAALVQKEFVLNFITSYMALFFSAFVYLPFGNVLRPFLNFWRDAAKTVSFEKEIKTQEFRTNPDRLSGQMFYFVVTAQVINFLTEVVVPYAKRAVFKKVKEVKSDMAGTRSQIKDDPEEAAFLERVRNEAELPAYDVTVDYREMVIQYGYLSLFSVVWPLTAFGFLVNNWVEMRSDALKIAVTSKRPVPWRADSIGPWLDALGFLSWMGSITSAAIVFLCNRDPSVPAGSRPDIKVWGLLLSILLAEHFYLLAQKVVRMIVGKMDSPGIQRVRKERYLMKKQLLEEDLKQDVSEKAATPGIEKSEKINREILEEEARQMSIKGHGTPEEQFWQRQRGMADTIQVGRGLIAQYSGSNASNKTMKTAKA